MKCGLFQAKSLSFRRMWGSMKEITSLSLTRSFQIDWLKVTFLGEVETVTRLGIKSWFIDVVY